MPGTTYARATFAASTGPAHLADPCGTAPICSSRTGFTTSARRQQRELERQHPRGIRPRPSDLLLCSLPSPIGTLKTPARCTTSSTPPRTSTPTFRAERIAGNVGSSCCSHRSCKPVLPWRTSHSRRRLLRLAGSPTVSCTSYARSRCPCLPGPSRSDACTMLLGQDSIYIEDLGSTNGTRVNGVPLRPHSRAAVGPGDTMDLGAVRVRIDTASSSV